MHGHDLPALLENRSLPHRQPSSPPARFLRQPGQDVEIGFWRGVILGGANLHTQKAAETNRP